jgi:hypothetical protein
MTNYILCETISYLYWKIFDFYKNKGYDRKESGRIAKIVCIKRFGYDNYQDWKYRARNDPYYYER